MTSIVLYCDANYPRGLSVVYQVAGHRGVKRTEFNYVRQLNLQETNENEIEESEEDSDASLKDIFHSEVLRKVKYTLNSNQNEVVTQIDMWKYKDTLQRLEIYVEKSNIKSSATTIRKPKLVAGHGRVGIKQTIIVPPKILKEKASLIFSGSYIDGYPFPRLIDLGLKYLDTNTGEFVNVNDSEVENDMPQVLVTQETDYKRTSRNIGSDISSMLRDNRYIFFDLMKKQEAFVRLTWITLFYKERSVHLPEELSARKAKNKLLSKLHANT
jgi:hypothetical protein